MGATTAENSMFNDIQSHRDSAHLHCFCSLYLKPLGSFADTQDGSCYFPILWYHSCMAESLLSPPSGRPSSLSPLPCFWATLKSHILTLHLGLSHVRLCSHSSSRRSHAWSILTTLHASSAFCPSPFTAANAWVSAASTGRARRADSQCVFVADIFVLKCDAIAQTWSPLMGGGLHGADNTQWEWVYEWSEG